MPSMLTYIPNVPQGVRLNFAIDGVVLDRQPSRILLERPRLSMTRVTGGGFVASPRPRGNRVTVRWGERAASVDTVAELKLRLGSTLAHTIAWNEPDGTARSFSVIAEQLDPEFFRMPSYREVILTFSERPA